MRWSHVALLGALVTLAACASANKFMVPGAPQFQPIEDWTTVQVYTHPDSVPGEYVEIAHLEGKGTLLNSRKGLIEALQREAAEVGANAIIFLGYDSMGLFEAAVVDEEAEYRQARGTAIRVL
jgi:hypothetical protein